MANRAKGRYVIIATLILLLAGSFWVRERGIEWPLLHPDEYKITRWANWIEEHSQTENAAYPGGYFHLIKPALILRSMCSNGASAWEEFKGHRLQTAPNDDCLTFFLRKTNVWLSVLTILLVYGLGRRVSGSAGAGLAASALLAFSRLHVEHTHYAETDIAMVFTLALALYGWVRVLESGRVRWFVAASLLTGLAIGTKYTNLLLLLPAGAGGWICWNKGGTRTASRAIWLAGFGLLLVACGWCYTNRHIFEGLDFWRQLQQAGHAAYGERNGILGASATDPHAVLRSNWNVLAANLADVHWGWLIFIVLGACWSCLPRYRQYWPVTLLPMGLYLFYCLQVAPWIRGQECLVFFPFMAACLAIGVKESMAWAHRQRLRALWVTAIILVMMTASGDSLVRSLRFSSLCEVPEPRVQALRWLHCHAPLEKKVGVEAYTVPACRLFESGSSVEQIEWVTPDARAGLHLDYLLRNVSACGRGTVDPRTGTLYPNFASNLADFKQKAHLVCEWGPREPNFAFVGHQVEWWDMREGKFDVSLRTPMFRPALIDNDPSVMVPLSESEVGSAPGLFVDTTPRSLIVSGSSTARRTIYVVLQTKERSGEIIVNGMGDRHVVHLDPYDVKVVEVRRPPYWPRVSEYDEITIRARQQPHVEYLPCYAQAVTDVRDVALLLHQKGYSDYALAWLTKEPVAPEEAWLLYVCAVEQEQWSLAESYEPLARQSLANFETIRSLPPDRILLNGVCGATYLDHARIRLPLMDTGRDGIRMNLPEWSLSLEAGETDKTFSATLATPVRLPPGNYTVRGSIGAAPPLELTQPWLLNIGEASRTGTVTVGIEPGRKTPWTYTFAAHGEQELQLSFSSAQRGGRLLLSGLEIQWNGSDLLWAERREIYRALIRHAAQRGQSGDVKQWLGKARNSVPDEEDWLIAEHEAATPKSQAAQAGIVFHPWLKLTQARGKGTEGELQFDVLKDSIPALQIVVYRKHWGGPRRFHTAPVAPGSASKGDRLTLSIPLPKSCPVTDLYVRVQADVEWGAAPLHVNGFHDGRVSIRSMVQ